MNQLAFKLLSKDAKLPTRGNPGDAGLDIYATSDARIVLAKKGSKHTASPEGTSEIVVGEDESYGYLEYDTGIAVAIPEGYVGLIVPRSSVTKTDLALGNSVGVIDSGYRGEIGVRFRVTSDLVTANHRMDVLSEEGYTFYKKGDRIAQLLVVPCLSLDPVSVDALSDSERGAAGWGSTGN